MLSVLNVAVKGCYHAVRLWVRSLIAPLRVRFPVSPPIFCGKKSLCNNTCGHSVMIGSEQLTDKRRCATNYSQVAAPATTDILRTEGSPEAGRQLNPQYRHRVQCVNGFVFGWFDSNSVHQTILPSSVTFARLTVYQQGGGEYPPMGETNYAPFV